MGVQFGGLCLLYKVIKNLNLYYFRSSKVPLVCHTIFLAALPEILGGMLKIQDTKFKLSIFNYIPSNKTKFE